MNAFTPVEQLVSAISLKTQFVAMTEREIASLRADLNKLLTGVSPEALSHPYQAAPSQAETLQRTSEPANPNEQNLDMRDEAGEMWRPVPNFPRYMISNHRRVKSVEYEVFAKGGMIRSIPPRMMKGVTGPDGAVRAYMLSQENGPQTSFSLKSLMKNAWPELGE